jgi:hypothetical protein
MQETDTSTPPYNGVAKLDGAKQVNFAVSAVAIAAAAAFWMGGAKLHLAAAIALALVPSVLIYLVNRDPLLYAIGKPKGDPRTELRIAFMTCGFGMIMGNSDAHFVETQTLLEFAGLVALLCCALIFQAARQNPKFWSAMFGTLFVAGLYGWALACTADSVTDKSAPAHYITTVADKYESYHRGTSYHLVLEPWGPMQAGDTLTVSNETYNSLGIGGKVCLELHSGALHVQWYRSVACGAGD